MNRADLLAVSDRDLPTLERLAARSIELGRLWEARELPQTLSGARIGIIEEMPGWRNPTALALGAAEMGGTCVRVTAKLEGPETVKDLAGYLENWFDLLAVRTPSLERLRTFADALVAPVINLRTQDNHPCEILGDLCFVVKHRGTWDGLRVAVVGPAGNIAQSWLEAGAVLPIKVTQFAPKPSQFSQSALPPGCRTIGDLAEIYEADLIVTDCWPAGAPQRERDELAELRITADVLDRCKPDVLFVPCPPVTRGEEVSADAMDHPRCFAKPAKAFLMHVQNAIMEQSL